MASGLIDEEDGVGAWCHLGPDCIQMPMHGLGVAAGRNQGRTGATLGKDTPDGRSVQSADGGKVVAFPQVGGLHYRYERVAA